MDTTPQNQIKPLLTHTIHIKSLYTYQSFLVKRPKHTKTFKASRQSNLLADDQKNQTKSELMLQKALHLLKSVKKVDLSKFQVRGENLNHNRLQSYFKHNISKASTLFFTRHQYYEQLGPNFAEKPLKYLSNLRNLAYELTTVGLSEMVLSNRSPCNKDPLRHLRYCPKIESLQIRTFGNGSGFSKIFSGLKSYPNSLKRLAIKFPQVQKEPDFALHLERFVKLESVYFKFEGTSTWKIEGFNELSRAQSLRLEFVHKVFPEIYSLPTKIADKKMLKKLCLHFSDYHLADKNILKALTEFDQLTHLQLKILIREEERLDTVSECLEKMKQLQDLSLSVSKTDDFQSTDSLKGICQRIQKLESLRHLHLAFCSLQDQKEMPNFILYCQPLRLETLSLIYKQLDPVQSLLDLAAALKDSSASLRKLKVSFGSSFSLDQKSPEIILKFISSLSNLQVLEMIDLDVEDDNFLSHIVKVISSLKSLSEFTIGEIKDQVTTSVYENALETILSKRGLRRFQCQTCDSLAENCGLIVFLFNDVDPCKIDMRRVERKNPFLERVQTSDNIFILDLLKGIDNWP